VLCLPACLPACLQYVEYQDDDATLDRKVTLLAEWMREARHMIAFTGAGISTACGIPDFRSGQDTQTQTQTQTQMHRRSARLLHNAARIQHLLTILSASCALSLRALVPLCQA